MTIPAAEAWDITPSEYNSIQHRSFRAVPKERLIADYDTFERYRNRVIKAVVPVEVLDADIRYHWDDRKQMWSTQISLRMFELNPQTMERYSFRNPKSAQIQTRDQDFPLEEAIRAALLEATLPKTRIVVTEVPL